MAAAGHNTGGPHAVGGVAARGQARRDEQMRDGQSGVRVGREAESADGGHASRGSNSSQPRSLSTRIEQALTLIRELGDVALDNSIPDDELIGSVQRLEALARACQGRKLALVAEIGERQAHRGAAAATTTDLLATTLRLSRGEAKAQADLAEGLRELPQVAAAVADGRLGIGQAQVTVRKAGEVADREDGDALVARLDTLAATGGQVVDKVQLARQLDREIARQAPDALKSREEKAWARRGVWFDNTGELPQLRATLSVEGYATVKAAVEALGRPTEAGDERSVAQRHHDALLSLAGKYLDAGKLPDTATQRPHVILVTTPDSLHGHPDAEPSRLDGVGPVSHELARQVCCDADITRVIKDADGSVLDAQADKRDPTPTQRKAVIARDQACIGCGAPVTRCEVHHIHWYGKGGATTVNNLVLVCWNCHRHVHHHGWQITLDDAGRYRAHPPDQPANSRRLSHLHPPPGAIRHNPSANSGGGGDRGDPPDAAAGQQQLLAHTG